MYVLGRFILRRSFALNSIHINKVSMNFLVLRCIVANDRESTMRSQHLNLTVEIARCINLSTSSLCVKKWCNDL